MSSSTYSDLLLTFADSVATITLNRVDAMNALNMNLKLELSAVIHEVANNPDMRALVITGNGKAFSAGGDISEMALNTTPAASRTRLQNLLADIFIPLANMEKPTIAAINGHAHGAGLSLALACDVILASENSSMSCAFSKIGLLPDCGSMYFLPRRVSMNVAKELIFTGRRFNANEALEMGIINRVVSHQEISLKAHELAIEFASGPTIALGMAKRILNRSLESSLEQIAELESQGQAILYTTEDHLNARAAFTSKSTPIFKGR